ncbi:MAG: beta-ketothiolase BktB [Rhodobacteraceae bacterium]|nr:beta-ketothiolase BktB [Paracoccaceae bacterium]
MTTDIFILSAVRTAIGTFGGALAGIAPTELAAKVTAEAIERSGFSAREVENSVFGNVIHTEPQDMYLSRVAAIAAGIPETAPALTLNRLCGSGLQAVVTASDGIALGHVGLSVAGGAENMSRAGHLLSSARFGQKMGDVRATDMIAGALTDPFGNGHMGVTAENIAQECGISRSEQDAAALASHRRAASAITNGYFAEQILPLEIRQGRKTITFDTDEHLRMNAQIEDFENLRPVFQKDGSVTAGNASGINDGAAALVLASGEKICNSSAAPLARIVSYGLGGVAPRVMGLGPVPAVKQAIARAGLSLDQIDVIESNEAFAAQACAVSKDLGFDPDRVNPNGGAIALGHPIGASGAIILTKLVHELKRQNGRYGLATMCIGGGQGIAMIVENAS